MESNNDGTAKPFDAAHGSDSLTASEWMRLKAWFMDYLCCDVEQKPANLSFTAGAARDAATAFESAVFEFDGTRIGSPNVESSATAEPKGNNGKQ